MAGSAWCAGSLEITWYSGTSIISFCSRVMVSSSACFPFFPQDLRFSFRCSFSVRTFIAFLKLGAAARDEKVVHVGCHDAHQDSVLTEKENRSFDFRRIQPSALASLICLIHHERLASLVPWILPLARKRSRTLIPGGGGLGPQDQQSCDALGLEVCC